MAGRSSVELLPVRHSKSTLDVPRPALASLTARDLVRVRTTRPAALQALREMPMEESAFLALLAAMLLSLAVAAPASAHDLAGGHSDWRGELAFTDVAGTVETVDRAAGTEDEGLPLTWCGDERTSDDVVHARNVPTLAQFKVVYAYASDRTDRFAAWKDALQADVSLISRFMGAQSGRPQGAAVGHGHQLRLRLRGHPGRRAPGARATYANNLNALKSAVAAQVPAVLGQPRNTLVLADRMSNTRPATGPGSARATSPRRRAAPAPTTPAGCSRRCGSPTPRPRRARTPTAGGPRGCCTSSRTTSARSATARRTPAATATATTATTSCATTTIPPRPR